MISSSDAGDNWRHPRELLKLQKLKLKKQALQKRINGNSAFDGKSLLNTSTDGALDSIYAYKKRKNPFVKEDTNAKKVKPDIDTSVDETLLKLLHPCTSSQPVHTPIISFSNILRDNIASSEQPIAKVIQDTRCPVDWTLKKKLRLISSTPFDWNQKLKISEEASGITSFARCLDMEKCDSSLNPSANAKFYQCSLYWQHPSLPWLTLFPRNSAKSNTSGLDLASNAVIKSSLFQSWTDSLKSLYQLIRTRQCPYFYVCANSFTVLFRAAGVFGYTDIHVMVTPTTRGFRHLLKEEDIEFTTPLKYCDGQDDGSKTQLEGDADDEPYDDEWLKELGVNDEDIKGINCTQARLEMKTQSQVDSSDQSLVFIEGVEVNSFFNFLLNCKSTIAPTGPLAGVPPTLLAPVSFYGATLSSLKCKESKIHTEGSDYYSLDLNGPILPSTIHNIFNINNPDRSVTATFLDVESSRAFSKVTEKKKRNSDIIRQGTTIFGKESLSDCGLNEKVLKQFCSADPKTVCNVDCLKYSGDTQCFTWT